MRSQVEALVKELEIMKSEGVTHVSLDSTSLAFLEQGVGSSFGASHSQASQSAKERKILQVRSQRESGPSVFERALKESAPSSPAKKKESQSAQPKEMKDGRQLPPPPEIILPEGNKQERWNWLNRRVIGCEVCNSQVKAGKRVVFGVGNLNADVFLCGEAPGADEEIQGEPFVGPAGQLLTKILATAGWKREDVYIGNIMNWRPDTGTTLGNRPPTDEELSFCLPYLKAQLEIVQPKVIFALGKTAIKGLIYPDESVTMGRVHGKWHSFEGIPLMPTYHPSYLLHNNTNRAKRAVWEDVLLVMEKLGMPISERQRGFFR